MTKNYDQNICVTHWLTAEHWALALPRLWSRLAWQHVASQTALEIKCQNFYSKPIGWKLSPIQERPREHSHQVGQNLTEEGKPWKWPQVQTFPEMRTLFIAALKTLNQSSLEDFSTDFYTFSCHRYEVLKHLDGWLKGKDGGCWPPSIRTTWLAWWPRTGPSRFSPALCSSAHRSLSNCPLAVWIFK